MLLFEEGLNVSGLRLPYLPCHPDPHPAVQKLRSPLGFPASSCCWLSLVLWRFSLHLSSLAVSQGFGQNLYWDLGTNPLFGSLVFGAPLLSFGLLCQPSIMSLIPPTSKTSVFHCLPCAGWGMCSVTGTANSQISPGTVLSLQDRSFFGWAPWALSYACVL